MSSALNLLSGPASSLLSQVQGIFGADNVHVTSTGRTPAQNAAAGGSATSQHLSGNAIDFRVDGYTPAQVQAKIAASGISYGQLIDESAKDGVTHIGVGTGQENLTYSGGRYVPTSPSTMAGVTMPVGNATSNDPASVTGGVLDKFMDTVKKGLNYDFAPALNGAVNNAVPGLAWLNTKPSVFVQQWGIILAGGVVILFGIWQLVKEPVGSIAGTVAGSAAKL